MTAKTPPEVQALIDEHEREEAAKPKPIPPSVPGPVFHKDFIKDRDDLRLAVKAATVGLTADEIAELSAVAAAPFIRPEGIAEFAPPVVAKRKRIRYRETGSDEERSIDLDPEGAPFLMIERQVPRIDAPWLLEQEVARLGAGSLDLFVLEDVEED